MGCIPKGEWEYIQIEIVHEKFNLGKQDYKCIGSVQIGHLFRGRFGTVDTCFVFPYLGISSGGNTDMYKQRSINKVYDAYNSKLFMVNQNQAKTKNPGTI